MQAQGYIRGHPDGMKRIVISFDQETFEDVRRLATKSGTSFAEAARTLITWGLETDQ